MRNYHTAASMTPMVSVRSNPLDSGRGFAVGYLTGVGK
jgi:hypothetical protein